MGCLGWNWNPPDLRTAVLCDDSLGLQLEAGHREEGDPEYQSVSTSQGWPLGLQQPFLGASDAGEVRRCWDQCLLLMPSTELETVVVVHVYNVYAQFSYVHAHFWIIAICQTKAFY